MNTRITMYRIIILLLLLIYPSEGVEAKERHKSPNIVMFLVDDLGWSDVECYGSSFYETPNINRLADEGVRFTDAYAACHVCSPTRASILTGKYPATLNLTDWLPGRRNFPFQKLLNAKINQNLPHAESTLAEVLKANGYSTSIFGKWHLGKKGSMPVDHGFDIHIPDAVSNWRTFHGPFGLKKLESKKGDYLTDRLTDEAIKWIEEKKDEPFFLYMSHFAVHDPIQGRQDLVKKYEQKLKGNIKTGTPDFILEGNPDDANKPSEKELSKLISRPDFSGHKVMPRHTIKVKQKQDNIEFAGMVEAVDQSLGRILRQLDKLNITENTVVIFTSDNGGMSAMNVGWPKRVVQDEKVDWAYSTSNLPLRGAKGWLYEGGIRVPLIIKWPGAGKIKSVCSTPVSSIDFYPTILEMTGNRDSIARDIEGVSLAPLIRGSEIKNRALFWHFPHYSNHGMQSPAGAIREGDFKLIEYFENGSVQLFNLRADKEEKKDLSMRKVQKTEQLRKKLHQWREQVSAQMMQPNPDYDPSTYPWLKDQ